MGEAIEFEVNLVNVKQEQIDFYYVTLEQKVSMKAVSAKLETSHLVIKVHPASYPLTWHSFQDLVIPLVKISTRNRTKLIKIAYELKLTCSILGNEFCIALPIEIGNIAFEKIPENETNIQSDQYTYLLSEISSSQSPLF